MLLNFNSETNNFTVFQKNETVIPSGTINLGEREEFVNDDGIKKLVHVPAVAQFVPFRKLLKKFFELPYIFSKMIDYSEALMEEKLMTLNLIQGELFLKKVIIKNCNRKKWSRVHRFFHHSNQHFIR